jgi:hypothetical protein
MPVITDPRYSGALVGPQRPLPDAPPEPESPALLDTLAAASRQATIVGAGYERLVGNVDPDDHGTPPGYDPLDDVAGYEDFASAFADATTPSDVMGIKRRINGERRDRETLSRAGLGGPVAEIGLNLADPSFLVAIAVPELAMAKAGRLGRAVQTAVEGAAVGATYEGAQQTLQETRTGAESAFTVGGAALLGGVLGSLTRHVPIAERQTLQATIRSEVGAASATAPTTLERESFAAGGDQLSRLAGAIPLTETDLQKIMRSESLEARQLVQELADVPGILGKNLAGDPTPHSVEALVVRAEGAVADFADTLRQQWATYRQRVGRGARVSRDEFNAAVAAASRRLDQSPIPEVAEAARTLRSRVFDPWKRYAQELGLLPKDVDPLAADSYFRRMYDRDAIRRNRRDWDDLLTRHFQGKGADYAEARALTDDITRRILGMDRGLANFNLRTEVPDAGPLHDRVLDIRDELLERYLVNDPLKVATAYVRELAPQVEMVRRFGDKDLVPSVQKVRDEYAVLRERARGEGADEKRLDRLSQEERDVVDALLRIRDRLYGRAGIMTADTSSGQRTMVDALRGWRNLVASAKLGATAVTGGSQDLARIIAQYGFTPTLSRLAKFATSPAVRQLSKANARRLGIATEVTLARRVQVAADGDITEGWTERLANLTYSASGLNHVTDLWRSLAATLIEDKILSAAATVATKHGLGPETRTHLASLGLGLDELRRIHQNATHIGKTVEGVRTSGSRYWLDADLADRYDAAIIKEARIAVMQPGIADRVFWMDGEIGKTLGQLKSFTLSAPVRLTMAPVQMLGQGRYAAAARFTGFLLAGGYLSHVFRQVLAGKTPVTDPAGVANEAFAESGLGGLLPELVSPWARRFGLLNESARYSDRNVTSAFGGPAVGSFVDAYDVLYNRTQGGLSARDLQAFRRLLPLQNLWWLRRAINALEGETAEALNLEGATPQSFGDRVLETRTLAPTAERGGTGTGQIQF